MKILQAKDFGIYPNGGQDQMLKLRNLLNQAKVEQANQIEFEEGEYHFYPKYAHEELLYISNHDEDTIKRIAFLLKEMNDLVIKGNNTKFQFHTDIIPFYITESKNVTVQGITIDYARPIYSEGKILEASETSMTIAIDKQKYPYAVKHKRIFFIGENFRKELTHMLEMDVQAKRPAYNTRDIYVNGSEYGLSAQYEEVEEGVVRINLVDGCTFERKHTVGNLLILRHHPRSHPAFYVTDNQTITLKDINIHHSSGMAFIAQHTKDITLDNFNVCINPENERIFTSNADATHFVYCYGQITIQNCLFENQLDDPVNIHGIYAQVSEVISPTQVIVRLVHDQQRGVRIGKIGERINFVNNQTMLDYNENKIKDIVRLNEEYTYIELESPCDGVKLGHVIENKEYIPNVLIKNCIMRNNRARGCLLTSTGDVVIENNHIATPGAGILIEGDANYWFESGSTKRLTIRNNVFDNCAYVTDWGHAPIQVTPVVREIEGESRYHKLLTIEGNTFKCFDERLIFAKNIEQIIFRNNEVIKTTEFEPIGQEKFKLQNVNEFME